MNLTIRRIWWWDRDENAWKEMPVETATLEVKSDDSAYFNAQTPIEAIRICYTKEPE